MSLPSNRGAEKESGCAGWNVYEITRVARVVVPAKRSAGLPLIIVISTEN